MVQDDKNLSQYAAAKEYVKLGWALVQIPPKTKGPNQPGWNIPRNCVTTEEKCEFWKKRPSWNMGVLLNESGLVVLDIDDIEYTKILLGSFGIDYESILAGAPRIAGKPGHDKAIFKAPEGIELGRKALSWPKKEDPDTPVTVIEFRAGAIQDVLPPSIHPDTGRAYEWKVSPDNGIPEFPKKLLTIWTEWDTFRPQLLEACPWSKKSTKIPKPKVRKTVAKEDNYIQKYNDSNDIGACLSRYGYTKITEFRYLSPYSSTGLPGVRAFPADNRAFSHHASDPFDPAHSFDPFELYCQFEYGGNVSSAVRSLRSEDVPTVEIDIDELVKPKTKETKPKDPLKNIPKDLLTVPGVLGQVVDYYNESAPKRQPQFAVQTALALGSVAMGRRWKTSERNYSSLYFVCVGKSSSGKEHPKTVIEKILTDANCEHLIGPPGYTSSGGVVSALLEQPTHIAIIDELGKVLDSSNKSNNANKQDAMTTLMEAFGRLHSILRPQGYSTMTLNDKQKETMAKRKITHPALTVIGMTTPDTFYNSLSNDSVTSGFIPRFLIVETAIGRQVSRRFVSQSPDPDIISWVQRCATASEDLGNLSGDLGSGSPPEPIIIPIEDEALDLFDEFGVELKGKMDKLDRLGLDEMLGKTREISMRVALIVAVSCGSSYVLEEHAEWAIKYVKFYAYQTVEHVKDKISNSDFEAGCKEVYVKIRDSGIMGLTRREITRVSPIYRACEPKQRDSMIDAIMDDHDVECVDLVSKKGGRHRIAYRMKTEQES